MKLETEIENKFVEEVGKRWPRIYALKMEIPGWRNWPDRQILCGDGYTFFIEFKRPNEKPRAGQVYRHSELRKRGYNVYVCDNVEDAMKITEKEMENVLL